MGRAAAVTAPLRRSPRVPSPHVPRRRPVQAPGTRPAEAPGRRPAEAPARRPAGAPTTERSTSRGTARPPRGAVVLDALLRGRTWIGLVFVLLAGIVFLNVNLLRINRQIAVSADRAQAVKLENARLRSDIARLGSSERIQRVAAERGLVLPAPGEVRYLKSAPRSDARRADARLKAGPPQEATAALSPQEATVQPPE
jgi:cell division protein FtsL